MEEKKNNEELFRKSSLDRVSSPDELEKYIKATTPPLWLLLISVTVLLCGVLVWARFSTVPSCCDVGVRVSNGQAVCYLPEVRAQRLTENSCIKVSDRIITFTAGSAVGADESSDSFLLHAAGIEDNGWYVPLSGAVDLPDGDYRACLVFEEVSPISFILN